MTILSRPVIIFALFLLAYETGIASDWAERHRLFSDSIPADSCFEAINLTNYFQAKFDSVVVTDRVDNTLSVPSDTSLRPACFLDYYPFVSSSVDKPLWFKFVPTSGNYHIESTPCQSNNYINDGDTQMVLFKGNACDSLVEIACNDDYDPLQLGDNRAGLDFVPDSGALYYLLVDGWTDHLGLTAAGEYCLTIVRREIIHCPEGRAGDVVFAHGGLICLDANLADYASIDTASFRIPIEGPVFGVNWLITKDTLDPQVWPDSAAVLGETGFLYPLRKALLANNGNVFAPGQYYLTPLVLGNGVLIDSAGSPTIDNVNPDSGCYHMSRSQRFMLLPALQNLSADYTVTPETFPPGQNGAIDLTPNGGSGQYLMDTTLYKFVWSNGSTAEDLDQLSSGAYWVTVADVSGCVDTLVLTIALDPATSSPQIANIAACTVYPNPATDGVRIDLALRETAEVRILLLDPQGEQVMPAQSLGQEQNFSASLALRSLQAGEYVLMIEVGKDVLWKKIVVQR